MVQGALLRPSLGPDGPRDHLGGQHRAEASLEIEPDGFLCHGILRRGLIPPLRQPPTEALGALLLGEGQP